MIIDPKERKKDWLRITKIIVAGSIQFFIIRFKLSFPFS